MNNILEAALTYKELGFSVVPVLKNKRCLVEWTKFQKRFMDTNHIITSFNNSYVNAIAIVCGKVSGNFEGLDIDMKYDLSSTLLRRFQNKLQASYPDLLGKLVFATTKNNGIHLYYRCSEVERNMILAERPCTPEEIALNPRKKSRVLIETRSNGGYIIVPPSAGYNFLQKDLSNIKNIGPKERQALFTVARGFNTYQHEEPEITRTETPVIHLGNASPLNDYNQNVDLDSIIHLFEKKGWTKVSTKGPRTYFRRPGITDHETSGDYHEEYRLFKVFSTNTEFELDRGYKPSAIYAILECGGDFKLAAKRLVAAGYGTAYNTRKKPKI